MEPGVSPELASPALSLSLEGTVPWWLLPFRCVATLLGLMYVSSSLAPGLPSAPAALQMQEGNHRLNPTCGEHFVVEAVCILHTSQWAECLCWPAAPHAQGKLIPIPAIRMYLTPLLRFHSHQGLGQPWTQPWSTRHERNSAAGHFWKGFLFLWNY